MQSPKPHRRVRIAVLIARSCIECAAATIDACSTNGTEQAWNS